MLPGYAAVALMVIWAEHDGGYDDDTWYWGALVLLVLVVVSSIRLAPVRRMSRPARWSIALFGAYAIWSYLSIAWAGSPGDALEGSNRTLLYLLIFGLFAVLPWTAGWALVALALYSLAIGVLGVDVLYRLSGDRDLAALMIEGRVSALTGYFNATACLFTMATLLATTLATRREIPSVVRAVLLGLATASLQVAVAGQSRGWLFTLPFVAALTVLVVRNRFRFGVAVLIPLGGTLLNIHRLLGIYTASNKSLAALEQAARSAGHTGLIIAAAAAVAGLAFAWLDDSTPDAVGSRRQRRVLGIAVIVVIIAVAAIGANIATHGHPGHFISRQWNGLTHGETGTHQTTNFAAVGSGRWDFWRVALDAFSSHPIGGLGQDNFADYYLLHRQTAENPAYTHSLELRLLASTGIVGFLLFAGFLIAALSAAAIAIRRFGHGQRSARLGRAVAAAALLPLIVWLLHGSVDWFWEFPALSGPALGFLGMAVALSQRQPTPDDAASAPIEPVRRRTRVETHTRRRIRRTAIGAVIVVAIAAATLTLTVPYIAVREVSSADNIQTSNPAKALGDLKLASQLNPLWSQPGRLAGTIALETGREEQAASWFREATKREPGGWYGWFGLGLAQSALGHIPQARHALRVALSIDRSQPTIEQVLHAVASPVPIPPLYAIYELTETE